KQQALPFPAVQPSKEEPLEEMEPLAPNPLRQQKAPAPRAGVQQHATPGHPLPDNASPWKQPGSSLLNSPDDAKAQMLGEDTTTLAKTIQDTLRSFRVEAEVRPEDISIGPTVIRFGIRPTGKPLMQEDERGRPVPVRDSAGNIVYETRTRVSRIMALQNDLALVLESKTIRMEAPVPGRPYVGVEIPNKNSRLVTLREILESKEYQSAKTKSRLTVALGKDVAGAVRVGDLAKMPHLLIAGATGAGKCLAYDEAVFLADGRVVKVQELIGQSDYVIGVTDTQTMQQTPVLATFTENGVQDVFEITLDNGLVIRRTGEHPLWAAMLDENQHVGRQANGKAERRTRAIKAGWVHTKDLRVCGNRPNFEGHVLLCPLSLSQPLSGQTFSGCPSGYEWRKIVSIRKVVAPTVNIEVHSENHAFVGYVVEHNSVMINAIISSVITQATPDDVRMLMVDPKMVELSMYNGIPHLLSPVVIDVEKVVGLLKIAIAEMERRYRLFSQLGVRNLDGYRKMRAERLSRGDQTLNNLPAIVIIIDELADLMMAAPDEVEGLICRLAQLARATGIHLVVATQRPSVDVITGLIKANIPTRISFMVSSAVDSRTIIDMGGAERLLGRGDMLYLPADAGKPERIQGAFVADEEAERLVHYWREQAAQHAASANQNAAPAVEPGWEVSDLPSDEFELEDDLLEQAEQVVQEYERASISLLQRRLKIGYSRAARLIDLLEERGVISRAEPGGRAREVLEPRGSSPRYGGGGGEGRTLADEAADIIEEERLRAEALKRQAEREQQQQQES
ncbi:MAG TPA: DNA translocase FtsK, partial [Ktedonobacteraceae bacterium]|nr:DNA translocase FtsK [Ktedonobacteraceae bacterium]